MTTTRSRWLTTLAVTVALALVAAWYYRAARAAAPPVLTTAPVTRGDVVTTVDATGTLQAVTTVQVGTQVSGTIKALHADFNQRVRRGQVIAELEPSLFQTQVEQARASLARLEADARRAVVQRDNAQQQLQRARELSARSLIPASELDAAEAEARSAAAAVEAAQAQVEQARASLNQSQVNLGHTIIRAPIDGVVISRNVDVGQTVAASMQAPTLFVIAQDLTAMQVNANVAESDVGRIAAGQRATFRVDAYPGVEFHGVVKMVRLDPVVEQNVVSYVTTLDVANPDLRLKPGMTANVTIEVERAEDVLRIPNAALRVRLSDEVLAAYGQGPVADGGQAPVAATGRAAAENGRAGAVWAMRDGQLARVPVTLGTADATHTAVLEGALEEGMPVVTGIAQTTDATSGAAGRSPLLPAPRRTGATRSGSR